MKTKKAKKKKKRLNPLVHENRKAKARLGFVFPAASSDEIQAANRSGTRYEYTTYGRDGKAHKIDQPKDQFFRRPSEGRIKGVRPKKKSVKLRLEFWNKKAFIAFLEEQRIVGKEHRGWFITMNKPAREFGAQEHLFIVTSPDNKLWRVEFNRAFKHLIIDDLEGEYE